MLPYLKKLKKYNMLWYVTITPYNKKIELNTPPIEKVISSFQKLVEKLPNSFVGWRYDPIFLTHEYTLERYLQEFEKNAKSSSEYTNTCVISFLDLYEKNCTGCKSKKIIRSTVPYKLEFHNVKNTREGWSVLYGLWYWGYCKSYQVKNEQLTLF